MHLSVSHTIFCSILKPLVLLHSELEVCFGRVDPALDFILHSLLPNRLNEKVTLHKKRLFIYAIVILKSVFKSVEPARKIHKGVICRIVESCSACEVQHSAGMIAYPLPFPSLGEERRTACDEQMGEASVVCQLTSKACKIIACMFA